MRKNLILLLLFPLFANAQSIPDFGFDKVRIVKPQEVIQADIISGSSVLKPKYDRSYYWYHANTINSTQGGYSGVLLNGTYEVYYLNKNLKEKGLFKNGLKEGIWKKWNENGLLTETCTWKDGIRSGAFTLYDDQGKVKLKETYKNNEIMNPDTTSLWHRLNIFRKKIFTY